MGALCKWRGIPHGYGCSLPSSLLRSAKSIGRKQERRRSTVPVSLVRGMACQQSPSRIGMSGVELVMEQEEAEQTLVAYHIATKHSFNKFAAGPPRLDWNTQPNPFRRYVGAKVVPLEHLEPGDGGGGRDMPYPVVGSGNVEPSTLTKTTLSQLLFDSLALSAWKKSGGSKWSLRVNPSSGNLHPTEGYVISSAIPGVSETPFVAHYAPKEHALEVRAELPLELWNKLMEGIPDGAFLVGFSSIFWRESWKYGERALRYCNHDVGHAIGAVAVAGANLGWNSVLLDCYGTYELSHLLGLAGQETADAETEEESKSESLRGVFPSLEREHADCIMAVFPWCRESQSKFSEELPVLLPEALVYYLSEVQFLGQQNALSKEHVRWQRIYQAGFASRKPNTKLHLSNCGSNPIPSAFLGLSHYEPLTLRQVVRSRRSAVDMDGQYGMQKEVFYQILLKACVGIPGMFPYGVLPWPPEVHMAIFVHRVVNLPPGLYFVVRNEAHEEELKNTLSKEFVWVRPSECPSGLRLYRLKGGDCSVLAARLSCNQDIAGNSFFSLGMIARFEPVLEESGPWMYPRLFWEAGLLGQVLYLEATAMGVAATGIGCYFDDAVHEVLGITYTEFQSLYHFTIGVPMPDNRILTLPAYPGPGVDA